MSSNEYTDYPSDDMEPNIKQQASSGVFPCPKGRTGATDRLLRTICDGHSMTIEDGHTLQNEQERQAYFSWKRDGPGFGLEYPALEYHQDCQDCVLKDAFDRSVESGPCSFAYVDTSEIVPFHVGLQLKARKVEIRRSMIGLSNLGDSRYNLSYYVIKAKRGERVSVSYDRHELDPLTLSSATHEDKVTELSDALTERLSRGSGGGTDRHQVLGDMAKSRSEDGPSFGDRGGETEEPLSRTATALLSSAREDEDERDPSVDPKSFVWSACDSLNPALRADRGEWDVWDV